MTRDLSVENEYYVRLGGKGNIEKPLEIGRNYRLNAAGTITSLTESDLNDGRHIVYYRFQPINIELVTDLGESIKARDTRSASKLLRARFWSLWNKSETNLEFSDWYDGLMLNLIKVADDLVDMYGVDNLGVDKHNR